ncbi:MAG TPA: amidohydrolase [Candidatus Wallbacteria bacterium]|nr:amidohydrolase [Candidatus Wallbacteria bacterium]
MSELVLKNGVIYTADIFDSIVEAAAVKDGKIIYTGDDQGVKNFTGPATEVIDLNGKMVLPGLWDTHIHMPGAKLTELYHINLYDSKKPEDALKTISDYIKARPDKLIYYGGGLSPDIFSGEELLRGPKKERLDNICPDKPVIITFNDLHGCWLNSKALEINGITSQTKPHGGGVIEIDPETGLPWGILKETAMELIKFEEFSGGEILQAVKEFQKMMHGYGYTAILAIDAPAECLAALSRSGELNMRVSGSFVFYPDKPLNDQFDELKKIRSAHDCPLVKNNIIKIFVDGVVEHGTAYLHEPYLEGGKGPGQRGIFLWDAGILTQAFIQANKEGLQLHVHSIGDAATGKVLDALAAAETAVGRGDYRNTITHLQLVSQGDYRRFRELGVIANVQPYWAFKMPSVWEKIDLPKLGERAWHQQPIGSFFKSGVTVTASSDYPVTVYPNAMRAVKIAVTRDDSSPSHYQDYAVKNGRGDEKKAADIAERVSIRQILRAFTINGAYSTFNENISGSIETGKDADLVILDNNLFDIDLFSIDRVKVQKTIFRGKIVYDADSINQ